MHPINRPLAPADSLRQPAAATDREPDRRGQARQAALGLPEQVVARVDRVMLRDRTFADSLLEEAGFELSVPPERKAALDRVRRPSVTRRQAYPHRATRGGSVVKRTAETAANSDPFARRSAV